MNDRNKAQRSGEAAAAPSGSSEVTGRFVFDDTVAKAFPDMVRRSIPGYEALLQLIAVLGGQVVTEGSRVYDLGCSRGAVSQALARSLGARAVRIIAVDNSSAMIAELERDLTTDTRARIQPVCQDVLAVDIQEASLVVLNFTLQFVAPDQRDLLVDKIFRGLLPGGAVVLSEKTEAATPEERERETDLHDAFRRANGYSQLELAKKRQALENVLIAETEVQHLARLTRSGFEAFRWFQCLQFVSWVGFKA